MNKTLYKNWLESYFIPFFTSLHKDDQFLCMAIKLLCEEKKIEPKDHSYLYFIQKNVNADRDGDSTLYDFLRFRYPEVNYKQDVEEWRGSARICYLRELAERITPHAVVGSKQINSEGESK